MFVSFYLRVPQIFCSDLSYFFSCEFCRRIGDLLATSEILRRLTKYRRREKMPGTENRKRSDGGRIGRGAQHPTGNTQVISLRISISLLWFETCFAIHYRRMVARPRGQRPGMATLRPSVDGRSEAEATMETPKGESPVNLRSGRASEAAEGNVAAQSNSAR